MANLDFISFEVLRDTDGAAYLGAKASYWADVGLTTPLATYSDAGLSSANTQPVVSDGTTGAFGAIYLQARRYWRTVTTSAGVSLPQFNAGPIDATSNFIAATSAPSPTYAFLRYHNTTDGHVYRRNAANSAWIDEGLVDSLGNAATVTEQLAGTATSSFSTPDSVAALWQRGTDIASAGTLSLPASGGGVYNVTGTTTINGIGSASGGRPIWLRFAGALTLTHNGTSFILPGAANKTTVAGDCALFINEAAQDATGSNWRCWHYLDADGRFPAYTNSVATQAQMETASATNLVVTPGRAHYHPGVAKCWAYVTVSGGTPTLAASYNINSITDTNTGRLTITIENDFSSASWSYSCSSEAPSAGTESFTNIRNATVAAGSIEVTTQNSGGIDTDPASYGFQGWGDL